MCFQPNPPMPDIENNDLQPETGKVSEKKHLIKITWLRRTLKTLIWFLIVVLLIPVLLYVPFVQDLAVKVAEKVVHDKTGMDVGIGQLRLKFPLDLSLENVYVVEASGDTMVRARRAIADVKLLPLLKLDVRLNRLQLNDAYYRMLSADSSMTLKVNAGLLEVDDKSSFNLAANELTLNRVKLKNGRLRLYMDVWKQKQEPDTASPASKPMKIIANNVEMENFRFGMSMLPTIDTLDVALKRVTLNGAKVDLGSNIVSWNLASISDGHIAYITPTEEYIKTHPAPPSTPSTGPPMKIIGDSISINGVNVRYAVKDAGPLPGFDASFIQADGISLGLKNFYNESSTVRLPFTRMALRERSGLTIVEGSGVVGIDSIGLSLDNLNVKTLYSQLNATANLPFAAMSLQPDVAMSVNAAGLVGIKDIESFMPDLSSYISMVPGRRPLGFDIDARGSISDLTINRLTIEMAEVFGLNATGTVKNALDYKKLIASVDFSGSLSNPALADKVLDMREVKVPAFRIKGSAQANGLSYGADFVLESDVGDVDAVGKVALTPEKYTADVSVTQLDVNRFVPDLGIGHLSAKISASGQGFNPLSGKAVTDAVVDISSIQYKGNTLRDLHLNASLNGTGNFNLWASSANPGLNFDIQGEGTIHKDDYVFDLQAQLRDVNLQQLGLTDSVFYGMGDILLRGNAQPDKWMYDIELDTKGVEVAYGSQYYHLPEGMSAYLKSSGVGTILTLDSDLTNLSFRSVAGLEQIVNSFGSVADIVAAQIDARQISIDSISSRLPGFELSLDASGRGLLRQFIEPMGMQIDTVAMNLQKDSIISGNILAYNFNSSSLALDTITLDLKERGKLLDYKAHLGNRRGTLDEFAKVNLTGYLGENRMSAFLNQWNINGEQGYRIGLTAAMMDSVVSVHITPLKSTIAYLPWQFNSDNYVDFNLVNKHIAAKLEATSAESSILARTQQNERGQDELYLNIDNLHIQDFLKMWAFAPDMRGDLDAEMRVVYDNRRFKGSGTIALDNFFYEKTRVGNFNLDLDAGYGLDGNTDLTAAMRINGEPALSAYAKLVPDGEAMKPDSVGLSLTRFPLKVADAFFGNSFRLDGYLNGDMSLDGSFTKPVLNGYVAFDSVVANIPTFGVALNFREDRLVVRDNVVDIPNFKIFGTNNNPLIINGQINAGNFSNILFDLNAKATNMQLVNSDKRSKADLFGKLFVNLNSTVNGPMSRLNVDASLNILSATDVTYRLNMDPAELTTQSDQEVVRFVNFNDTTQVDQNDSVVESPLNMRINADLVISPGARFEVLLSNTGTDKVELSPSARLNYFQNYMGDMTLNGTLTLGQGFARYSIPVIGEKMFDFNPASTIVWNGSILDPILNITATDEIKANVTENGNSRLVNFMITARITNTLKNLKAVFDLSTNDDLSLQNELQSMSPDQRQTQALNLLLYGQYMGQNTKANVASGNMLYSYLESQLNKWAANNIRGVDLTFGVNQYDKTTNGVTNTETSYSYQVSKSLFNNRFKILVGGNYSTDAADNDIAENLVSDVAFEYILKQTQTMDMSVKLFRHIGYESILEGEITEMGGAFVYKRRLSNLRSFFRFRRRKNDDSEDERKIDSVSDRKKEDSDTVTIPSDNTDNYDTDK